MNSIFKMFQTNPIESINELSNAKTLEKLITSIEPNIESINITSENDYGLRYANFVSIIDSVMKYLLKHPNSTTFNSKADFKSMLNINDILQKDKNQLILLAEMVIFISSISSNKESLDNLENCDNDLIALYLNIKEKYTKQNDDYSNIENNIEEERIDQNIKQQIEDLTKEIDDKNNKINNLIKLNNELDSKYKDALLQIESAKENEENNSNLKEDLMNEQTKNSTLTNELNELKYENESLKKKLEEEKKSLTFKLNYTQEKLISAESKLENFKALKSENEKLKSKLKELSLIKDKEIIISEKEKKIESLNKLIETITNDKESVNKKNADLLEQVYKLKEDLRMKNNTMKKLEKLNEDLQSENKRMDDLLKQKEMKAVSSKNLDISEDNIKKESGITLSEINKIPNNQNFEKEIEDLKQELETYKDCLNSINSEKDKLSNEKDKIYFEKEKCLNELQQLKLEKQKKDNENEGLINKLKNEISQLKSGTNNSIDTKTNSNNDEISTLKNTVNRQQEIIEALKSRIENEDDIFDNLKDKNDNNNNDEINKYIQENKNLKNRIIQEHELISSSFYELALQFMKLKANESEIESNKIGFGKKKTWLENERKKNFPSQFYSN